MPTFLQNKEYWKIRSLQNPTNGRLYQLVAPFLGENFSELRHYQMAIKHDPMNVTARNDYALALLRRNEIQNAEREFITSLEIDPSNALVHQNLAALYAQKGKLPAAEKHCRKAIEIDPNNVMTHRNLSKILDEGGNTWEAMKHNEIALRLEDGDTHQSKSGMDQYMTRRILAKQLVSMGRKNEAHLIFDYHRKQAQQKYHLTTTEKTNEILSRLGPDA